MVHIQNDMKLAACMTLLMIAACSGPSPKAVSPEEKAELIRKYVAAHSSDDPKVYEEAQKALLDLGEDAVKALVAEINRNEASNLRMEETLEIIKTVDMQPEMLEYLETCRVTIDVHAQPIREVIEYIRQFTQGNFVIDASLDSLVTITVRNLPVGNALNLIAENTGCVVIPHDGCILVIDSNRLKSDRIMNNRLYLAKKYLDQKMTPNDPDVAAIQGKLDTLRPDLEFQKAGIEEIIEHLRKHCEVNIVFNWAVLDDKDLLNKKVSFKIKDLVLSNCLKLILSQYGLQYNIRERVIYISKPEAKQAQ